MDKLKLEVQEWRRLLSEVDKESFPRIALAIQTNIQLLDEERCALEAARGPVPVEPSVDTSLVAKSSDALTFTSLSKFSWEQTADCVKVYISLDGVGDIPKECIKVDISQDTCEIQVRDPKTKNYKFFVRLAHPVDPTGSNCKPKKNMLALSLKKAKYNWWESVHHKEPMLPKKTDKRKEENADDPQASVMRLMRDLYDSGDDEMKRTIKKAWVEAGDKRRDAGFGGEA
eukprot:Lankesteria_metandrocarpae@DN3761_c1_g1_i1.p1